MAGIDVLLPGPGTLAGAISGTIATGADLIGSTAAMVYVGLKGARTGNYSDAAIELINKIIARASHSGELGQSVANGVGNEVKGAADIDDCESTR
jgi:hypothetical protein